MTCKTKGLLLALLLGGCGNYSNEDLEFMNALPDGELLYASVPPRAGAISAADKAELARTTHDVTRTFNGLLSDVVTLVDVIRSFPPTSRAPNTRVWGPAPAEDQPGWLWRMILRRNAPDLAMFSYDIAFRRVDAADTEWAVVLSGSFRAGQTARRGMGQLSFVTAAARAQGFPGNFGQLDRLDVEYDTGGDPILVHMNITNLPDPLDPDAVTQAVYDYASISDGRREMTFDFWGNVVPGPMVEKMTVESRWLDTGEGRATLRVDEGEGLGSMHTQCWNRDFAATYVIKDWAPAEDLGTEADCVSIAPIP